MAQTQTQTQTQTQAQTTAPAHQQPGFNPDQIRWQPFGDAPHFAYHIQQVDLAQGIADVLFRFDAGQRIILHRHMALNHTFVVRGTHVIYHADGSVKERRPTGSYTVSPADTTPHTEGGGEDADAIVLFSMRPEPGQLLYELLDDSGQKVGEIDLPLLHQLWLAQQEAQAEQAAGKAQVPATTPA
ncbi:regulator [Hydrogenophaga sp. 5NK40-0174]|uniref:cupin domain-containing protein n=1 Tax=Hydrogenophaga sp. 5NK40-0174 TaxID=3127649 RepID=UPI00310A2F83